MSPRAGRPPKEDPKNTRIQIRLDEKTLEKLDICVEQCNSNRSEIIRQGIEMVYATTKK